MYIAMVTNYFWGDSDTDNHICCLQWQLTAHWMIVIRCTRVSIIA